MNTDQQAGAVALQESRSRHAQFAAAVAQQPAQPIAVAAPNAAQLAEVDKLQAAKNEKGERLYDIDARYRADVEAKRFAAFGARPAASVPGASAVPDQPAQHATVERATEALAAGDILQSFEVAGPVWQSLTSGYAVQLPAGWGLTAEAVTQLTAARKAGLTQAQVTQIIADICAA